jgi:hypothetical protein
MTPARSYRACHRRSPSSQIGPIARALTLGHGRSFRARHAVRSRPARRRTGHADLSSPLMSLVHTLHFPPSTFHVKRLWPQRHRRSGSGDDLLLLMEAKSSALSRQAATRTTARQEPEAAPRMTIRPKHHLTGTHPSQPTAIQRPDRWLSRRPRPLTGPTANQMPPWAPPSS